MTSVGGARGADRGRGASAAPVRGAAGALSAGRGGGDRPPRSDGPEFKAFVGNISRDTDDAGTTQFIKRFGNPNDIFNSGKGYSFVKFNSDAELQAFVVKINGAEFLGQRVRADNGNRSSGGPGRGRGGGDGERRERRPEGTEFKAFVGDISRDADDSATTQFIKKFGPNANDIFNSGKGYSFVKFNSPEELQSFVDNINGKELCGQRVRADNGQRGAAGGGRGGGGYERRERGGGGAFGERHERRPDSDRPVEFKAFVGDISRDADDSQTTQFIKKFGNPRDIINSGKGYSFAKFETQEELHSFVDNINGKELCGQKVRADTGRSGGGGGSGRGGGGGFGGGERRERRPDEFKAFVGGISRDADDYATTEFIKKFGNPNDIYNSGKGYSFVKFDTADQLASFVNNIDGKDLCGQKVRADTGNRGGRGYGGDRGGGRGY